MLNLENVENINSFLFLSPFTTNLYPPLFTWEDGNKNHGKFSTLVYLIKKINYFPFFSFVYLMGRGI